MHLRYSARDSQVAPLCGGAFGGAAAPARNGVSLEDLIAWACARSCARATHARFRADMLAALVVACRCRLSMALAIASVSTGTRLYTAIVAV